MLNSKVKFNSADEVKEFVTAASKCDFDFDIFTIVSSLMQSLCLESLAWI